MAEELSGQGETFDLERVRLLMEMMEKHGLTELNLRHGDQQWKFRRGPQEVVQMIPSAGFAAHAAAPPMAQAAPAAGPASPAAPAADPHAGALTIKSPTVGTFYSAATPDDPPFVSVGSRVSPDTVVCLVEAMKVFNQIAAEVSGTVVEVLVKNGDAVEFGQPLFRVKAS